MRDIGIAALAAFGLCAAAHARSEIDESFGSAGFMRYGFGPVVGGTLDDRAALACPGPLGSLYVVGTASGDRRIVSAWLDERAALDPRFSTDGKESFDLPPAVWAAYGETGLCQTDGKVVMAMEFADSNDIGTLALVKLDPSTGLPDPTFGAAGWVSFDVSTHVGGMNKIEMPMFVSPGRDGDLLVGGFYDDVRGLPHGYLARVTRNGVVAAFVAAASFDVTVSAFGAAVPSPDGAIWAATVHASYPGMVSKLVRLDYTTLKSSETLQASLGDGFVPRSGRLVGDTLVLAGHTGLATPVVSVVRERGYTQTPLPAIPGASRLSMAQVVPQASGRLVVAVQSFDARNYSHGYYFAALRREPDDALSLDPAFGIGGVSYTPPTIITGCTPAVPQFARMTLWNDRPVWVGSVRVCDSTPTPHFDYLVMRLKSPAQ
jgi:hypothetical protein